MHAKRAKTSCPDRSSLRYGLHLLEDVLKAPTHSRKVHKISLHYMVQVCPGYGIGPYGDEIEVQTPTPVDIHEYVWRRPHDTAGNPVRVAYIGIRYAEQQGRPVPTQPPGCKCEATVCEPSRIRDGFQVDVLWRLPEPVNAEAFDMCEPRPRALSGVS